MILAVSLVVNPTGHVVKLTAVVNLTGQFGCSGQSDHTGLWNSLNNSPKNVVQFRRERKIVQSKKGARTMLFGRFGGRRNSSARR